jgi:DNA mismatch repair protein MSH6
MESLNEEAQQSRNLMKGMVDLERLLGRVHSIGSKKRSESHPDSRAIMYEMPVYNSKKIKSFGAILEGFENVLKVIQVYEKSKVVSPLLVRLVKSNSDGGRFPMKEISQLLSHFRSIFDEKQAKRDGTIKPKPGADPEYDQAKEDVAKIESELEVYLRDQKKSTGINDLKFWGTNKDRFQIEVPINLCNKVPSSWCSKSQKKTHRRYWTPFIEKKLSELVEAEERLTSAQNDSMRRIFEKFDNSRDLWSSAVSCCAYLDGLLSLALVSSSPSYCWPTLLPREKDQPPVLHIHGGRHPMLEQSLLDKGDGEYISNTVILGGHAGQGKS